jgi:DNA (cytosine-5)-methyltransferase 1
MKPTVISLFSGAGGLDFGVEAAGFQVAVSTDMDHDSCETLRRCGSRPVIERDIFELPTAELLARGGVKAGELDLLIGGPPCQPFSKASYWGSGDSLRLNDPRAETHSAYLSVLEDALPRAFLLENVDGLIYTDKSEGLGLLLAAIDDINHRCGTQYEPAIQVLNAAEFGVPQSRRRLFVVASREGTTFHFPRSLADLVPGERARHATGGTSYFRCTWDAIGDLPQDDDQDLRPSSKWCALLPSIPEGKNYLWHTDRGKGKSLFGWRRRYWGFLLKLAKNLPSWTIPAQPGPAIGPFHWANRRLSRLEMCRLQTFPDHVQVVGNLASAQRQIGNAVPSLLAEILGRELLAQFFGQPRPATPPILLPPRREQIPPPEPVLAVPEQYQALIGEHAPHPGTGKGPAATARRQQAESLAAASG